MMMIGNPHSPFFHEERHALHSLFTPKILERERQTPLTICGIGSLGGAIAETLARMGYQRLTLIDDGQVEERNLSCQPYSRAEIGTFKARALANTLYRAVGSKVTPLVAKLTEENSIKLLLTAQLVIDAFDNHKSRLAVAQWAQKSGVACLHVGFSSDGLYGSGLWEPGYLVPQDAADDPCDYPLTRPFAQMVAALACRVIGDYLREGVMQDFELTWNDLQVSIHSRS